MAVSEITIGLLVGGLLFVLYLLYRSVTEVLSYNCICPDMNDLVIHKLIFSVKPNQWPTVFSRTMFKPGR